jgi:Fe-S cluster assembly protein SufD
MPSAADQPMPLTQPYLAEYAQWEAAQGDRQPRWLHVLRKAALTHFCERGFPTAADEEWKYNDLTPVAEMAFKPILTPGGRRPESAWINDRLPTSLAGPRLVFVDGHFCPELSAIGTLGPGIRVTSLAAALAQPPDWLPRHLGGGPAGAATVFATLNLTFFQDGALVEIAPDVSVAEPIQMVHIATGPENGSAVHLRNLVLARRNSRVTLAEYYLTTTDSVYLTNTVTELVLAEGAQAEHVRVQQENPGAFHFGALHVRQARDSGLRSHSIALGARLARQDLQSVLAGPGADCLLNGLFFVGGDQRVDHHTVIDHAQPRGTSHEFYHGILLGQAKGVFNGKILVRRGAQKTDAKQTNRNLLLSDGATIDAKPQLEIFADDVRCTHGATVGRLNPEAVFYLRSRGIGDAAARRILVQAFADEILERISHEPLRAHLRHVVQSRNATVVTFPEPSPAPGRGLERHAAETAEAPASQATPATRTKGRHKP